MMVMYALEPGGRRFILAFVVGCLLSSACGFLSGACDDCELARCLPSA
jgi:hypothetical protein